MKSVYSAVRTGPLNKAVCASSLKGSFKAMIMCHNDNRIEAAYWSKFRAEMVIRIFHSAVSAVIIMQHTSEWHIDRPQRQWTRLLKIFSPTTIKTKHSWCKDHTVCNNGKFRFATYQGNASNVPSLAFVITPLLFKSILLHALHIHAANILLFPHFVKFKRWEIWSQWK
jgi:hypothetical protein